MPDMTPAAYATDERDSRLDHALDLLAAGRSQPANGAMPLIAMMILALSGALLITQLSSPKVPAPVAARAGGADVPQAPAADFELSSGANGADTGIAPAGSERSR